MQFGTHPHVDHDARQPNHYRRAPLPCRRAGYRHFLGVPAPLAFTALTPPGSPPWFGGCGDTYSLFFNVHTVLAQPISIQPARFSGPVPRGPSPRDMLVRLSRRPTRHFLGSPRDPPVTHPHRLSRQQYRPPSRCRAPRAPFARMQSTPAAGARTSFDHSSNGDRPPCLATSVHGVGAFDGVVTIYTHDHVRVDLEPIGHTCAA